MIPDITVNINNNINFYSPARQVSSETHIHRTATDMNAPPADDDEDDDSDSDKTITDNENNEGNESDDSSNTYQTPPSSSDECD